MLRESSRILSLVAILLSFAAPAEAIDAPMLMRESAGRDAAPGLQGCPLEPNLTGDCADLRYYNLCSGYIWIYTGFILTESVGVRFDDPCVVTGNALDKAITYFRNVLPGYGRTVDVLVDADVENDGCPDYPLLQDLDLDPGLRWNCSDLFGFCAASGLKAIIIRTQLDTSTVPTFATDGPFSETCDPVGTPHSYYYGLNGADCVPWVGPTERSDNFLYWLIVDSGCTTSTEQTSWGAVKGLFK